jgi:hypothetical protein
MLRVVPTSVTDLRVGAVEYFVSRERISATSVDPTGGTSHHDLGPTSGFVERIDALKAELGDQMAVARGRVPQLNDFADTWGRELLPDVLLESPPDVVVLIPHSLLHDLPFHLVKNYQGGEALGTTVGVSYASSRSLFVRCAARNTARHANGDGGVPRSFIGGGSDVKTGDSTDFAALAHTVAGFFDEEETTLFGEGWPYTRAGVKAPFRRGFTDTVCVVAHGYGDPGNHRMSGLMVQLDTMGTSRRSIPLHGGRYFDFGDQPLRRFPSDVRVACRSEVLTLAELEVDGHVDTRLVALLACSTGRGRVLQGDEPASLAESFLHIGAPSVLAPMWDSAYDATRAWAEHFFDAWVKRGRPKALAARDATKAMADGPYANQPERLGALALRGDWL